ncbi:hypothetical protein [Chroococcidiopsis sp. CCALA 051]|nr:hypothetical protein [Chroococcidiopsis sp. CCALA 051]
MEGSLQPEYVLDGERFDTKRGILRAQLDGCLLMVSRGART